MKRPVTFMARNHVAANLLMLFLVVGGLFTAGTIKQEIFPDVRPEMVNVIVAYPGATPAEVEDAVVLPIELAVSEVDYIKRIRSVARDLTAVPFRQQCKAHSGIIMDDLFGSGYAGLGSHMTVKWFTTTFKNKSTWQCS